MVVYDPEHRGKTSAKTQAMSVDYSAFEGWELQGRPSLVTVRGEVQAREGEFAGRLGRGEFFTRAANHY